MMTLRPTDALIVVDMQTDFLPGGPLAVPGGHEIIPGINDLATRFEHVLLTSDWHPEEHISFARTHGEDKQPFRSTVETAYGTQSLWPVHCVQGTPGADITPHLDIPHAELLLRKGFRRHIDSYSAFVENDKHTRTGLSGYLRERELKRLFFCGLALDFCVGHSALDAVRLGFEAVILEDLTRAVGLPGTVEAMRANLQAHNVRLCQASSLVEKAA